jgi:LmbE family N-acetylglucosaminyl deacetylase
MKIASLDLGSSDSPSVLCIGAHCDDIEIGCGGTLLRIAEACPSARFDWIVFCSDDVRRAETRRAADQLLADAADCRIHFLDHRDGFLPYDGAKAKDSLREFSTSLSPDIVFTHYRDDAHQDHRLVSEITANLFRDHLILEYEIPKFDGDLGRPNVYFPLDEDIVNRKAKILLDAFRSQSDKHWFTEDTFRALPRLRGIEAGRSVAYAEAFYNRKLLISTG